jgi:hypothetical protein
MRFHQPLIDNVVGTSIDGQSAAGRIAGTFRLIEQRHIAGAGLAVSDDCVAGIVQRVGGDTPVTT